MRVAIPKEIVAGETRVAATPETVGKLVKLGHEVVVEAGAGSGAHFSDDAFRAAGARIEADVEALWSSADAVFRVHSLRHAEGAAKSEADMIKPGALLIGFLRPIVSADIVARLAERKVATLGMEFLPRITRAQSMDALTSMAAIAGYKAVLLGAVAVGKFFPMMMTPAGTIAPSRVLIVGAGVAGLQAIGTARRLGAVVEACDIRPVAKEQVESLGATFVNLGMTKEDAEAGGGYAKELSKDAHEREQQILHERLKKADVVITTAQIPGKKAPVLITEAMVRDMAPGSVIVDIAAEQGGNCELTEAGKTLVKHHVTILGPVNLPATTPVDASRTYARNVLALFQLVTGKDGKLALDLADEIVKGVLITHDGNIVHEGVRKEIGR